MTGFVLFRSRPSQVSKREANLSRVHLQTRRQGPPLCGMSCPGPWRTRCTQHQQTNLPQKLYQQMEAGLLSKSTSGTLRLKPSHGYRVISLSCNRCHRIHSAGVAEGLHKSVTELTCWHRFIANASQHPKRYKSNMSQICISPSTIACMKWST